METSNVLRPLLPLTSAYTIAGTRKRTRPHFGTLCRNYTSRSSHREIESRTRSHCFRFHRERNFTGNRRKNGIVAGPGHLAGFALLVSSQVRAQDACEIELSRRLQLLNDRLLIPGGFMEASGRRESHGQSDSDFQGVTLLIVHEVLDDAQRAALIANCPVWRCRKQPCQRVRDVCISGKCCSGILEQIGRASCRE